jgi:uncharacterized DUF497 family protein
VADAIRELLATEAAMAKLAGRGISTDEAEQVLQNAHVTVRNPRDEHGKRRLLIGRSDGGRALTLVIEATIEPTTWLLVTGWNATEVERNLLDQAR